MVHADGVLDEDAIDGHSILEVFVVTEEGGAEFAGVVAAACREGFSCVCQNFVVSLC